MAKNFDTIDYLLDTDRVNAYKGAIDRYVRSGDIVLDCGIGSGILSIMAARAGAKCVYASAKNKKIYDVMKDAVKSSGFSNVINVIHSNASVHVGEVDVAIMECIDSMMIGNQAKQINALINRKVITNRTKVIPRRIYNMYEPVCFDFDFFDCHLPMVIQSPKAEERCVDKLGSVSSYAEYEFINKVPLKCHYDGRFRIAKEGWLNALKFSTISNLTDEFFLGATADFCMPVYVPVHCMHVEQGDIISVEIDYQLNAGYDFLKVNIS
jgi:predicted RNA methylase